MRSDSMNEEGVASRIKHRTDARERRADFCVLGAKSLLNKNFTDTYQLYGGVPARPIKSLSRDCKYFQRTEGLVV